MKPLPIVKSIALSVIVTCFTINISAQTIGTFGSITPTAQTQSLVIPATHRFQRIIRSGDPLSLGGNMGSLPDFTGYVPISGSSRNGYLSISSETTPAAVAVLGISFNSSNHLWNVNSGGNVSFPVPALQTTSRFCSGTVTPNGTIIVSEESNTAGDINTDGYTDVGWLIEIDPATRTVIESDATHTGVDKLWAIGKTSRENAAIKSDNSVLFTGADDGAATSFLYKFVPTVPGNFSSGLLYVLRTTAALGTGTWKLIPNTTQAQRNGIVAAAQAAPAAFSFNGIEDVEFGPIDGKIYFTAKSEGKIYRFTDNGTFGTATDISGLEVFAGNDAYPTIKNYDVDPGVPVVNEPWGRGNDNLAFDGEGNLWVCQDAIVAADRNHIWVIGPTHTQASPQVRVFATTPTRSEPTGITFTPDYKFMFISFMNPSGSNTTSQLDAAGTGVIFSTHTTVVIGRVESLGSLATLPVRFTAFDASQAGAGVAINWSATDINNHDYFSVERSLNGTDFTEIHRNNDDINGNVQRSFNITDDNLPAAGIVYYRIRQCDINGACHYSDVKKVKLSNRGQITRIYPQPAKDKLNILYYSLNEGPGTITITDINGKTVMQQTRKLDKGTQAIEIKTNQLGSGMYLVTITDKYYQQTSQKFIKE